MGKAGAIIGIIAGILGFLAAIFTLFLGGVGSAIDANGASSIVSLGWGGVFFAFLSIVVSAIAISNPKKAGVPLIVTATLGAYLGGTFVAVCMALALVGGILCVLGGNPTIWAAIRNLGVGAAISIGLLFAVIFFSDGRHEAHTNHQNSLAALANSQPDNISSSGDLAKTFKFGGDSTDLQRENALEKIKGKVVQWSLPVYDIHRSKDDTYRVQTEGTETVGTFVTITPRADSDRQYLASLKTGDLFTFKGVIAGVSMRNLEIQPAILISNGSSVGNEASQQGIPQGNIDQNSQQQQTTDAAAMAAYGRQDYQTALKLWQPLAEQGDSAAQNSLGIMYQDGQGVPKDYGEAMKWFRKAAEQGDAYAQNGLGSLYQDGQGVTQDYAEALQWYRKAAEQGNASGQNSLGVMYFNGQGVPQDYAEAVKWFRKAAEQGNAVAQLDLAGAYHEGQGVPQDYAESLKWYRKAADQGLAAAQDDLGGLYQNGQGVPQDYAESLKWYRKAADQGLAAAQDDLGGLYQGGQGVPQDYAESLKWYRKAADQGLADAQNRVGFFYSNGLGVAHDYAEALKWYRKAADQGHAAAENNLGGLYQNGQGVPQDYAESLKWYRKAADQGFADAQNNLGFMYTNGLGVPQDHAEAAKWYQKADQGATITFDQEILAPVLIISLLFLIGGCYACVRLVRKMQSGTKDTPLRKSDGE